MSITVYCATCAAKLKAPDSAAGKRVKCPQCSAPIVVPAESMPTAELDDDPPPPPPQAQQPPQQPAANLKTCPYCGEQVQAVAVKCRHCGETIDVAMRTAEEARRIAEKSSSQPNVFMNAGGGGGGSSSSSSSAAAAASGGDWYQQQAVGLVGCLFLALMLLACCIWVPSCTSTNSPSAAPASTQAGTRKINK